MNKAVVIIGFLVVSCICFMLMIMGVGVYLYKANEQVNNVSTFQECVDAGNPVMLSYPTQCITPDGKSFTEDIYNDDAGEGCVDACGNGICDTEICFTPDCPCYETSFSCPIDCSESDDADLNGPSNSDSTDDDPVVGMPNPASEYCVENGGTSKTESSQGGERGICVFNDGSQCDEWEFMLGMCMKGQSLGE